MRGELSKDFLHAYFYAILIIIIAIGVLYYSGLFEREDCVINGGFTCNNFAISQKGISMDITNIQNTTIEAVWINISNCNNKRIYNISSLGNTGELFFPCSISESFQSDIILKYNKSNNSRNTFTTSGEIFGKS